MTNNLNFVAFMPLAGGFPIGMEQALDTKPSHVFSYEGFEHNDSFYLRYLTQQNYDISTGFTKISHDPSSVLNYGATVDVVATTCRCAGLSTANVSSSRKDENGVLVKNVAKNSNERGADAPSNDDMLFTTEQVLRDLSPRVLVGENAMQLYGTAVHSLVDKLRAIGQKYGYTLQIVKTSTLYHGLPQHRKRTFYFFWKGDSVPLMDREHGGSAYQGDLTDFFKDLQPHGDSVKLSAQITKPSECIGFKFLMNRSGLSYSDFMKTFSDRGNKTVLNEVSDLSEEEFTQFENFCQENNDTKLLNTAIRNRARRKVGSRAMDNSIRLCYNHTGAMYTLSGKSFAHPVEDRFVSVGELAKFMAIPDDYELPSFNHFNVLFQNVPVCTAKAMGEFIKDVLNTPELFEWKQINNESEVLYQNNMDSNEKRRLTPEVRNVNQN